MEKQLETYESLNTSHHSEFSQLCDLLSAVADLELAILIGSQASGTARPDSDWDIAIQWARGLGGGDSLAWTRLLQRTWRELEEHYWEQIYAA